jgi:GNAT superfamily N-acetyltransferase
VSSFQLSKLTVEYLTDAIQVKYNNNTVGYVLYDDCARVHGVFVEPDYRSQGVGRLLITLVERSTGLIPTPVPPVSILGQRLFK